MPTVVLSGLAHVQIPTLLAKRMSSNSQTNSQFEHKIKKMRVASHGYADLPGCVGRPGGISSKAVALEGTPPNIHSVFKSFGTFDGSNPLLSLPVNIRNDIYQLVFAEDPANTVTEVLDLHSVHLPALLWVSKATFQDAAPVFFSSTQFRVYDDTSAIDLSLLLKRLPETVGHEAVRNLKFCSLVPLEYTRFPSSAWRLIKRCPNLRRLSINMPADDLIWTKQRGFLELDLFRMCNKYDMERLWDLNGVELQLETNPVSTLFKGKVTNHRILGVKEFRALKHFLEGGAAVRGNKIRAVFRV